MMDAPMNLEGDYDTIFEIVVEPYAIPQNIMVESYTTALNYLVK